MKVKIKMMETIVIKSFLATVMTREKRENVRPIYSTKLRPTRSQFIRENNKKRRKRKEKRITLICKIPKQGSVIYGSVANISS